MSSSTAVVPHMPQPEVVAVSRGRGGGARPPVSTLTTLNSLSTADPVPQYRQRRTGAPPSRPSLWQSPAASSKSWPGVRIVVATRTPSRWISSGSSTMSWSGWRRRPEPS